MRSPYGHNCITVIKACQQVFVCYSIISMRVGIAIAVVLTVALYVGAQERLPNSVPPTNPKAGSSIAKLNASQKTAKPNQANPTEPQIAPCNQASPCHVIDEPQEKSEEQKAKEASLDSLYRRYMWATIIGVVGGLIGVVVLICQTIATRTSAEAALRQANHIITSERAWMVAEPGDANIPPEIEGATGVRWTEFSVRFVNKGKTPAFLIEIGYQGKVLPRSEKLPFIQPLYKGKEISRWGGKGLPVLPGADVRKNHLGTWASDPVKITRGFDVLWVYGYIKYADAFGFARETWYCYRWVHEIERYQASGFIAGGPESYNRAT